MTWFLKNWPSAALLLAGVVACIASFVNDKRDSAQQEAIQTLGEKNVELSNSIMALNEIHTKISQRTEDLAGQTKKTSDENIELSKNIQRLLAEVEKITSQSQIITAATHSVTSRFADENRQTGELIHFEKSFSDDETLTIRLGGVLCAGTVSKIKSKQIILFPIFSQDQPISVEFDGENRLLISVKVYNFTGDLVAEIYRNNWRPNRNFAGKYNYDNKGFEVIDNQGRIVLSIDFKDDQVIKIYGIFFIPSDNRLILAGTNDFYNIDANGNTEKGIFIEPIFHYYGQDWLGKRR